MDKMMRMIILCLLMCINLLHITANGQVISFAMRKLAYSTNQFGLDLMRATDKSDISIGFCPICISSSLVMMLMGSQGNGASSLRHALYLWGMQTSEINLAFHDMMTHLGVNMPAVAVRNLPDAGAFSMLGNGLNGYSSGVGGVSGGGGGYHPGDEYMYGQYRGSPAGMTGSMPATSANIPSLTDTEAASGNDIAFLSHVYVQRDFGINYNYHMLLQRFYKTAIHPVDFIDNADETRHHINAMIEKETRGKIASILPERLAPTTQLLLLSALYFKGSLDLNITSHGRSGRAFPFYNLPPPIPYTPPPPQAPPITPTSPMPSLGSNLSSASSLLFKHPSLLAPQNTYPQSMPPLGAAASSPYPPNMLSTTIFGDNHVILEAQNARIRYGINRYLNSTAIEMPFKGGLITLVAIMPNDPHGLDTVLTKLSAQVLSDVVNSLQVKRVNVKIPKLSFDKSDTNLSLSLANLGLSHIFKPGYSQLFDISDYKWLHVSDIIHKTYLEIRDNPPASRQSSSSYNPHPYQHHSSMSSNNIEVIFDKPFLYFIMDNISGLILAMGKFGREPVNYRLPAN